MTLFRTLDDASVSGKRVLVRVDLNVPMEEGRVTDTTRIDRILPTIREIADKGGKVILLAHFGRPKGVDPKESLKPVAAELAKRLGRSVGFADDCIGDAAKRAVDAMKNGDIVCLENTRFHKAEEKNEPDFVKALAANGDLYVNDAFSAAHRAHASTEGLAKVLPAYAGRTMQAEIEALAKALEQPERPVLAVVGGAKVSTKLELLGNLVKRVNILVIGGGMANTFLAAQGKAVGKSLCEKDLRDTARALDPTLIGHRVATLVKRDAAGAGGRVVRHIDPAVFDAASKQFFEGQRHARAVGAHPRAAQGTAKGNQVVGQFAAARVTQLHEEASVGLGFEQLGHQGRERRHILALLEQDARGVGHHLGVQLQGVQRHQGAGPLDAFCNAGAALKGVGKRLGA